METRVTRGERGLSRSERDTGWSARSVKNRKGQTRSHNCTEQFGIAGVVKANLAIELIRVAAAAPMGDSGPV